MAVDIPVKQQHSPVTGLKGYRLFRIFGFDVKLNLTWLLLAFLITWTLAAGMFPIDYPGLAQQTYWWMGIAGAVGILFSIVFHELSHSLVARHYGLTIRGITLFIFGGMAEMEDEPVNPKAEFMMAVAGPVASIILGIIFVQITNLATALEWHTSGIGVSHYLAMVNIILAVFNLVPAFPLDGGRMLRAALWHWKGNLRDATRIASQFGSGFGFVLMFLGGFAFFLQGNFIGGMWWFLIGIFLHSAAKASYRQLVVRELLSDKPVRRFMNSDPATVAPDVSIEQLLEDYIYRHHYKMFPVVEGKTLKGCISLTDIKDIPKEQREHKTVGELMTPCSSDNTVTPDTDSAKLIAAMARPNARTMYMVVEDNHLLGVISLKDLREYIALKVELEQPEQ